MGFWPRNVIFTQKHLKMVDFTPKKGKKRQKTALFNDFFENLLAIF
jgi:hypothetical protein